MEFNVADYQAKALANPEFFFENFLDFPLFDWQYNFINAVLDVPRSARGLPTVVNHAAKPRVTVRSCHGTGKTQALAGLSHIWNFCFYGKIAATAPKQDQLLRRFLPRYRGMLKRSPPIYQQMVNVKGRDVDILGDRDWGLFCETASDPDNLAGYHDKPQLFIVDEASSRRLDPLFPVIEGALTTPGSVLACIGNPTRMEGEFYTQHNRNDLEDLYFRIHVKHTDAPTIISPQWVNSMRIKYGEDSPIYKIRVAGEFADFDSATLIPLHFIEEAYDADFEPDGSIPKVRVSVDVADGGVDNTVITAGVMYDSYDHIKQQKSFNFDPSISVIKSAEAAIAIFEAHGGKKNTQDDFVIDANGVGAGTAGYLIKKGYNVVRHVGGSTDGVDTSRYKNRRTMNHLAMYDHFSSYRVKIDKDNIEDIQTFESHIIAVKRDSDGDDKRDEIQSADTVKAELGESPDKSASLSMWFFGEAPEAQYSNDDVEFVLIDSDIDYELY